MFAVGICFGTVTTLAEATADSELEAATLQIKYCSIYWNLTKLSLQIDACRLE